MDNSTHDLAPTYDSAGRLVEVSIVRKGTSAVVVAPDLEPWETEADENHTDVEAALASRRTQGLIAPEAEAMPEEARTELARLMADSPGLTREQCLSYMAASTVAAGKLPTQTTMATARLRHQSVVAAALKGGATDAEAKELADIDASLAPGTTPDVLAAYLRKRFSEMVSARVTTGRRGPFGGKPRHTVAKRYRARGRW